MSLKSVAARLYPESAGALEAVADRLRGLEAECEASAEKIEALEATVVALKAALQRISDLDGDSATRDIADDALAAA